MNAKRPPLERMAAISRCLRARGHFTLVQLVVDLEHSEKVLRRDINFMRDRLGFQIEFNCARQRWEGKAPKEPVL